MAQEQEAGVDELTSKERVAESSVIGEAGTGSSAGADEAERFHSAENSKHGGDAGCIGQRNIRTVAQAPPSVVSCFLHLGFTPVFLILSCGLLRLRTGRAPLSPSNDQRRWKNNYHDACSSRVCGKR